MFLYVYQLERWSSCFVLDVCVFLVCEGVVCRVVCVFVVCEGVVCTGVVCQLVLGFASSLHFTQPIY